MGLLPNWRAWHMINVDSGEEIEGDYEPTDLSENLSNTYQEHFALNRSNPITQFLHGNSDTLSFQARLYASHILSSIDDQLKTIKEWIRRRDDVMRPPIIVFWVGDSTIYQECVIESISDIRYDTLTFFGALRGATMRINLRQYVPFDPAGGEPPETRYHRAKAGDYFEMLCYREYGNPDLGDAIRKRNPEKPNLQVADVVKLPSAEAIRKHRTETTSIPLQDAYVKRETPQKTNRQYYFDARNRAYVSHVIKG